jgi:signal transduction histidine kinase
MTDSTQRLTASRIELFSNFLERACALVANTTSYQETLERVGALVVPLFADWCSVDLLERDGRWRRRLLQQDNPTATELQPILFRDFAPTADGPHPAMEAIATGKAELVPAVTDRWIAERTSDARHAELLQATRIHSALFLPLYANDEMLGVLSMYAADPNRPSYDHDDLRFGELLATVIAAALRNVDYLTNAAIELAERRRVEGELRESLEREAERVAELRAIMDAVPAAVWIANDAMCMEVSANAEARRLTRRPSGSSPASETGRRMATLSRGRLMSDEELPLQRAARDGAVIRDEELELVFDDGTRVFTTTSCVPLFDDDGRPRGAVGASLDITRLKVTEGELLRHRENLERMVQERTRALEESHVRLRESERMALIGTLSAGLGHDMGNLLLPLRLRLDALNGMDLPQAAKTDLEGIGTAVRYLQRLTSGLRLLARDPDGRAHDQDGTRLNPWWDEVHALMRDALPPGISMEAEFDPTLPSLAVPQAALTQIVLNLIQNAGHALKGQSDALITLSARAGPGNATVEVVVRDNGPGMTEETRRRCFEPFFSTKRRQLSTGLGLAVVRGLVERAHATIAVESSPGHGAAFTLTFKAASGLIKPQSNGRLAWVTVREPRARALVTSILSRAEFDVMPERPSDADPKGSVWITDQALMGDPADLERFVSTAPARVAVILGAGAPPVDRPEIKVLENAGKVDALRAILEDREAIERSIEQREGRPRSLS